MQRVMTSSMMRAIRVHQFGGPEVLKVEQVPMPKYGEKEVLIRIHAVGVNPVETYIRSGKCVGALGGSPRGPEDPGVDLATLLGQYPAKPQLPYTPGSDASGVIEAVGAGVNKFKVRSPEVA